MIAELREQREQIDSAILVLDRLAGRVGAKRRGRPPAWLAKAAGKAPAPVAEAAPLVKRRGRPPGSKNKKA